METKNTCGCSSKDKAAETLPGVAVNIADDNKVSPELVKQETEMTNNNPRSENIDE